MRAVQITLTILVLCLAISAVVVYNEVQSPVTNMVYDLILIAINTLAMIALVSLVIDTVPFEKGDRDQKRTGQYQHRQYDKFHPTIDTCVMWVLAGLDVLYILLLITAKLRLDSSWHDTLASILFVVVDILQVVVVTSLMHERRVLRSDALFAPTIAPVLLPTNFYHFVINAFFSSHNIDTISTSGLLPTSAVSFVEVVLFMAVVSYRLLAFCELLTITRRFDASVKRYGDWHHLGDGEEAEEGEVASSITPSTTTRQVVRKQQEMERVARVEECWWMNILVLLLLIAPLYSSLTCLVNEGRAPFLSYCAAYKWLMSMLMILTSLAVILIALVAPMQVRPKCTFGYFGKDEIIVIVCYVASVVMRVLHVVGSLLSYSSQTEGEGGGPLSLSVHIGDVVFCLTAVIADSLQTWLVVTGVEEKRVVDVDKLSRMNSWIERSKIHLPKCLTAFNMAMMCITVAEEMTPLYGQVVGQWSYGNLLLGVLFPLFIDFRFHSTLLYLNLHNQFQKSLQAFYRADEVVVEKLQARLVSYRRHSTTGEDEEGQDGREKEE